MLQFVRRHLFLAIGRLSKHVPQKTFNNSIHHFRGDGALTQTTASDSGPQLSAQNSMVEHDLKAPSSVFLPHNQIMEIVRQSPTTELDLPGTVTSEIVDKIPYWQKISLWKDVNEHDFLSYQWQVIK